MKKNISVLLLAGGKSSRMGGKNKALLEYQHKPMIEHLVEKLPATVDKLIISCNQNAEVFSKYTDLLVDDHKFKEIEAYSGPLLGILSAFEIEKDLPLLVLPCDTPEISIEAINKLIAAHLGANGLISCAAINQRLQPLHSLIDPSLKQSLYDYLKQGGRRAQEWVLSYSPNIVDCSEFASSFKNVNYQVDLI